MMTTRKSAPLLFVFGCFAALTAFEVPPYDMAAMANAKSAWEKAQTACRTRTDFKTLVEAMDCYMAADRDFSLAIRLHDAKLFETYAASEKSITADIAAGKIDGKEAATRFRTAQGVFYQAIVTAARDYQSRAAQDYMNDLNADKRDTMSNGMNGMGGMNDGMMH